MASNDDTQDTLSSLPSNQEGRDDQEQEGKEGKPNDAAADAPAKEGSRHKRRSSSIHRDRDNNGSNILKRRRHNNPRPRNLPEARLIQENNEWAYISEREEDEKEYLPMATRRRGNGEVVRRLHQQQQQQIWQQEQQWATKIEDAKNDASALSMFAAKKRNARCHCFNCW